MKKVATVSAIAVSLALLSFGFSISSKNERFSSNNELKKPSTESIGSGFVVEKVSR